MTNKTNGTAACGDECSTVIPSASVSRGNNSAGNGIEELFFCIEAVNQSISPQAYNATGGNAWEMICEE